MNSYQSFTKKIGLIGISNLLVTLSPLILLPILTKNYNIQDYGIWIQVNITIGLVTTLSTLGLPYSFTRFFPSLKKEVISEDFYSNLILIILCNILISFVLFQFSKDLSTYLFNGNEMVAFLLPIIIFIVSLNTTFINFFRAMNQMKIYSFFMIIQAVLNIIFITYFTLKGFEISFAVLGLLLSYFSTLLIMILLSTIQLGITIPKFNNFRKYLTFGLPLIPSTLSSWIVDSSDRYIIGIILGTAYVGYYSPGYSLGTLLNLIIFPFNLVLTPELSKLYDNNEKERVEMIIRYSLKYFLLISIPIFVGISLLARPILSLLTTNEIASEGFYITPFIALSSLFFGCQSIITQISILNKKTKFIGISWFFAAFLNLFLNIILVPFLGILGAGITTLISYFVVFVILSAYSLKEFKIYLEKKFVLKSVLASIVMGSIILVFDKNGVLNILFTIIIATIIYFSVLIALKGIKKEEYKFMISLINSK